MFYKYENQELLFGEWVQFPDCTSIQISEHEQYEYPIDGWYYFETEEEAKDFFGIEYQSIVIETDTGNIA